MKLTGELKDKVDKAKSKEQVRKLIAEAGMELTDEEVEMVAGGRSISRADVNGAAYTERYDHMTVS